MSSVPTTGGILDLDKVLGKPKNWVNRVGVELEGGWVRFPALNLIAKYEGDGSVFANGVPYTAIGRKITKKGEVNIGPMMPAQVQRNVLEYYPDVIDKTCGMHVHMSFARTYEYSLLADTPVFQETMLHYLLKWATQEEFSPSHHIWDRLKGNNKFCTKNFWPYSQAVKTTKDYSMSGDHRYTAVSYQWSRYKTVEVRALPMMDKPQQALRAIREVLKITNAYLVLTSKVKVGSVGTIILPSGESYSQELKEVI